MSNFVKTVCLAALFSHPLAALAQDVPPAMISVTGEGRVSAEPDLGMVALGVRREAATAAEALQAANAAAADILETVQELGVEPRDVQTIRVALNPVWEHRNNARPKQIGYEAVNDLSIRVRVLDDLGALIDRLVSEGANSVQNIAFSIEDDAAMRDEARRRAVEDARGRAETMADAAGVTLGPLRHLAEAGGFRPPPPMPMMRMDMAMEESAQGAVPIASGELEVVVTVTASWDLAAD